MKEMKSHARANTIGYYAAFIVLGATTAILGPTLPDLAQHTRVPLSIMSLIFTARALGYLLGSSVGGRWYDRLPGHRLMNVALLTAAVCAGLIPMMQTSRNVIGFVLLLGIAHGLIQVGGGTLLIWTHQQRIGSLMNGLGFSFGVGAFLAPTLVAHIKKQTGGILWSYWSLAALTIPVILWLARLANPQRVEDSTAAKGRAMRPNRTVWLVTVLFLVYAGAESSFGHWISPYAASMLPEGGTAEYTASAFWGAITLGRLFAIPLAACLSLRMMLWLDLLGTLGSIGILICWSDVASSVWIGTLGMGIAMASFFPTLLAFAGQHLSLTGRMAGLFFAGAGIGGMIFPWLIGQWFEIRGPQVMPQVILLNLTTATGLLAGLFLVTKRARR